MHEITSRPDPLDVLATEFTARQRQGACPSIDEYATRHPELEDEIRVLFPTIATLEKLKVDQQRTPDGRVSLAGCRLERLGDFQLTREIGRGGMGIVYEAEQRSLARRVAVKVLPRQSLIDPKHLERFRREAQTAAALHHTNIVPVFGVGQHDGFHYYVMQRIEGVGVDRVLARLERGEAKPSEDDFNHVVRELLEECKPSSNHPTHSAMGQRESQSPKGQFPTAGSTPDGSAADDVPFRREELHTTASLGRQVTMVHNSSRDIAGQAQRPAPSGSRPAPAAHWRRIARLGVQVADALQYAHEQGTLHRDIKPANLIIDRQDVVWVADFGLAKALECEPASHSGDIVGTLAYMAPEQLQGRADRRSDIYSLGLTLYELLTLRPAFAQTDRTQLLQQIANGSPPRPRQVQPDIPRDLETIVLKAISREPRHRYESAAALATDLQCFLEDRPIRARRVTAIERFWRWCRRNPVIAGLSVTAAVLLILVTLTTSIGYARTNTALAGERKQRQQAEAATEVALQVLDRVYERFAPPDFSTRVDITGLDSSEAANIRPVLSEGAAAVLEDLLVFYDELAESGEDNLVYREKIATANQRVGDIRHHLGQCRRAEAAYQQALALFRQIDQSSGDNHHALEIATLQNELGIVTFRLGRPAEASRRFQDNLEFLEQLAAGNDADSQIRLQMDRALAHLLLLEQPGRPLPGWQGPHAPGGARPEPRGQAIGPPDAGPRRYGEPPPNRLPPPWELHSEPPPGRRPGQNAIQQENSQ